MRAVSADAFSRRSRPISDICSMRRWRCNVSKLGLPAAALAVLGAAAATALAQGVEERVWLAARIKGSAVTGSAKSTMAIATGGKVTGSGGCNRLLSTALISGDTIAFGEIGTTRMACAPAAMEQERRFLDALAATRTFRVEGAHLILRDAGGSETVRFTEQR